VNATQDASDCPSAPELRQRISERLGRDPFVATSHSAPAIYVSFTREGSVYSARISLSNADSTQGFERRFDDQSTHCQRLVDAVLLGVTLLLENEQDEETSKAPSTPTSAETAALPPPPQLTPSPDVIALKDPKNSEDCPKTRPIRESPRVPSELKLGMVLSHGIVSRHGINWGTVLSGSLFPFGAIGIHSGAEYIAAHDLDRGTYHYEFSQTAGFIGTVMNVRVTERIRLTPELGLMFGVMHAAVRSTNATEPGDFPFMGARGGAAAQWRLIGPLFVSVGGQLRLPFNRQVFRAVGVTDPLWTQPRLGLSAEMSVGLRFD
jgi:hypothetical protein